MQLLIFLAVFSFLQFYFLDLRISLGLINFKYSAHIALGLIVAASLFMGYLSKWSEARNFLLILLAFNAFSYLPNLLSISPMHDAKVSMSSDLNLRSGISDISPSNRRENIYYIIPDGMASPKIIQSYTELDIRKNIDSLVKKGFSVPDHNYSAYNTTHLSIASLFNMDYMTTDKTDPYRDKSNFYPALASKPNKLVHYLKSNGYKTILVPPSWGGCPFNNDIDCLTPYSKTIFDSYSVNIFLNGSLLSRVFRTNTDMDDSIPTAIKYMKTEPYRWSNGGTFTIVHTLLAHRPFREENCSIIGPDKNISHKKKYSSSVLCALKRIKEITDFIIDIDPDAVVIVQSDHGVTLPGKENESHELFDNIPKDFIDARMGNFNAAYGCGADRAVQNNQANIVKFVVECLDSTIMENKVNNRSFFGFYEDHSQYGQVFEVKK
jgi:hypothetical protein